MVNSPVIGPAVSWGGGHGGVGPIRFPSSLPIIPTQDHATYYYKGGKGGWDVIGTGKGNHTTAPFGPFRTAHLHTEKKNVEHKIICFT